MSVQLDRKDFNILLDKLPNAIEQQQKKLINAARQAAWDKFDAWADKHRKTGNLRDALFSRQVGKNAYEIGIDGRRASYAQYVSHGTKAHIIKPKVKKSLRWAGTNGFKFAKLVNHPGYKGDPIEQPAIDAAMEKFNQLAKSMAQEIEESL